MKLRTFLAFGAAGYLLPILLSFFLAGSVLDAVILACLVMKIIFFLGCFLRSSGKFVRFSGLIGAFALLSLFVLEVALLCRELNFSFLPGVIRPLQSVQAYLATAPVALFSLSALLRCKKDTLCVVLSTLSIVACFLEFYPVEHWNANGMFGLLLLYLLFKKPKL